MAWMAWMAWMDGDSLARLPRLAAWACRPRPTSGIIVSGRYDYRSIRLLQLDALIAQQTKGMVLSRALALPLWVWSPL
jgi:hypothetical protein